MEPEKHIVFWVCDDCVTGLSWLVELVKEPFQPLMGIVAHRVLESVVHQLGVVKCLFHRKYLESSSVVFTIFRQSDFDSTTTYFALKVLSRSRMLLDSSLELE